MGNRDDEQRQRTLDGDVVEDEEDGEEDLNDLGEEYPWWETKGGYRRDVMSSLFQKAVRRSDEEKAAFAAWELVRSGFESHYWNRAVLICIEDLVAGNGAFEHVLRYEELAKGRWEDNGWQRRLCAIAAALVCARAHSSRETTHANGYFSNTMENKARAKQEEDYEPMYEPPVTEDDLDPDSELGFVVADKHTYPGSGKGRGWGHFRLHGARIGPDGETEFGETLWRRVLEYDRLGYREPDEDFDESEIDHAVEPTDEEEPWRCELGGSELTDFD